MVLGRTSLALQHLGCLDLQLGDGLLARLGSLQLLFVVELSGLLLLRFLLFLALRDCEHLVRVGLGLEDGILGELFFFGLGLVELLECDLVFGLRGHLPVLAALGSSSELLRLSLRFLDDVADELRSFLDSDLHSDVKGISDFGRLRDNQGGSSLFGS